jgi:uncharacterized membrane protein (UPF0127 family)
MPGTTRCNSPLAAKALVLAFLTALGGCQCNRDSGQGRALVELKVGGKAVMVEVVATNSDRQLGLMHRRELPKEQGMLFLYPRERWMSFWMKNTLIPLSIAFLKEDGTIAEIHDMEPLNETPVLSGTVAKYALEMNKGWFAKQGIKPGDKVEIPEEVRKMQSDE